MALEAQLCPQCGATVKFAEMQTEVVCSYCGATVDKTLVQAIQRVNGVGELSDEARTKLDQLILDGRRQDALFFIQQYTGLGETSANTTIDKTIHDWGADHYQQHVASNREILIVAGIIAIDVLSVGALALAQLASGINPNVGLLFGVWWCGLPLFFVGSIWVLISSVYVVFALPWLKARLSVKSGQAGTAVLRKVVALPLAGSNAMPNPTIFTRLLVEVAPPGEQPRDMEIMMDLPKDMADRLRPGNKVEAISNGPSFVYITDPIKVVG